jgi:hypothetical protein
MAVFDPGAIGNQIISAVNTAINGDIRTIASFAERQAAQLAKQAAWIAESTINGSFTDDDDRQFFIDNLKDLTENFARTVAGLTILTLEKAWNAVVGVLWGAINGALTASGIPIRLPVPAAPAA